jgi:putative FmdB family regulatory protein
MPLYEYHCSACDRTFEALVSIRHSGPVPCAHCGSEEVRKLLSTFSARVADGGSYRATAGSGGCSGCSSGDCSGCSSGGCGCSSGGCGGH